jgi:hypothetical protein
MRWEPWLRGRPAAAEKALCANFCGSTEQLAEKVTKDDKTIPQGLKPESFCSSYGTAEAVPLQSCRIFRQAVKPCPFKTASFSASCEVAP